MVCSPESQMTMWKPTACQTDMAMIEPSAVRGIAQPVDRLEQTESERAEDVVQKAVAAVVDEAPEQRDDDDRDHDRHEIDRAESVDAAEPLVDQQRQQQGASPPCSGAMNRTKRKVLISAFMKTTSLAMTTMALSPDCQRNHSRMP